jgi:hypothetical protein
MPASSRLPLSGWLFAWAIRYDIMIIGDNVCEASKDGIVAHTELLPIMIRANRNYLWRVGIITHLAYDEHLVKKIYGPS